MLTTSFPRHSNDFAGVFVQTLARDISKRHVDVSVVAPHDAHTPSYEADGHLQVYRFAYLWPRAWQRLAYGSGIPGNVRQRPWVALQALPFLAMFLNKAWAVCSRCDVVHVHWAPLAWIGLLLRERYQIPVVVTVHGTDVRSVPRFLIEPVLNSVDAVIAAARETEALLRELGVSEYYSIPLPIDEGKFQPGGSYTRVAAEVGLEAGQDVVLFVGRLNDFKDPMTLVQAAPYVLTQRPSTQFIIVGDGPHYADLCSAIDDLGLQDAVHLMGARRDVDKFLSLSKVFVALSPIENAWSMTIAEAMHMRVPCIITNAGRTDEVFSHLHNAYLVEPKNEEALADAVLDLLSDQQKRTQLAEGALQLMVERGRDSRAIVHRTVELYQSVLTKADNKSRIGRSSKQ